MDSLLLVHSCFLTFTPLVKVSRRRHVALARDSFSAAVRSFGQRVLELSFLSTQSEPLEEAHSA